MFPKEIPSDTADRFVQDTDAAERLKKQIVDISGQKAVMDGHKEQIKESIKAVAEEHHMKPKVVSKMVDAYYKQNFETQEQEHEEFSKLYGAVLGGNINDQ